MNVGDLVQLKDLRPGDFFGNSYGQGLFVFLTHVDEQECMLMMLVHPYNEEDSHGRFVAVMQDNTVPAVFLGRGG